MPTREAVVRRRLVEIREARKVRIGLELFSWAIS